MLQSLNISKKGFFGKFYLNDFCYLLCPVILQSLKKILLADPLIWACINVGHNRDKIAHLDQMRIFFGYFTRIIFNHSLCPLILQSLKKMHNFESQLDQNCSFGQNRNFWGYFSLVIFLYLSCCKVRKQSFVEILWYKLA